MPSPRSATISRRTRETDITATWNLDGPVEGGISSGIGFFDHMLEALARHSGTGISLRCSGDLHIDGHHTVEDVGIVLGQCLDRCLGDKVGIERYGHIGCPLDEALVVATVDCSGRACLVNDLQIKAPRLGDLDSELIAEFLRAFADNARLTLHLHQVCGSNGHHIAEAAFKALARALRQAIRITGSALPSTKGLL